MNKIRNNMFYLMSPEDIYQKYGRFRGLGNAYTQFAQFGGESELDSKREVMRYSFHRLPTEEAQQLESARLEKEIGDFKSKRKDDLDVLKKKKEMEGKMVNGKKVQEKLKEEDDKLELINKLEERNKTEKTPEKKIRKKKRSFRMNRSSNRFSKLNSRLNNAGRFQRSSSVANIKPGNLKSISSILKCNYFY